MVAKDALGVDFANHHRSCAVLSVKRLLACLEPEEEFTLCGDFNAPRGGEIFTALAMRYQDNIPLEYASSIDGNLHRKGPLPYMVDGLFTTPSYIASDVSLQSGVSDHCAILATVSGSLSK